MKKPSGNKSKLIKSTIVEVQSKEALEDIEESLRTQRRCKL